MQRDAIKFLQDYAHALDRRDEERLIDFCLLPTVVMNDHDKRVFIHGEDLAKSCHVMVKRLQEAEIVYHKPNLTQAIRLSDSLHFLKMRWQFLDKDKQVIFTCATSYTLQQVKDGSLKIIVAVVDDDRKSIFSFFSNDNESEVSG
ncbi:MAG: hypothetical protein CL579_14525 [Alteromonadaceae bacterium]|uniref:SnoaL-like domain-containing protein n=2 Tax=Paraglaciecola mesophila TaxID=197222 RepID=K6YNB7_9ALTE|nr:hypothetical protein [Paraglaciecola mesophila]MAD17266.1 hypothetical protein [Alteromonadaceae bacterium]GAC25486.1 hypothetical protein GMES_3203 [Paraglaciecola mesophila KMM 241]